MGCKKTTALVVGGMSSIGKDLLEKLCRTYDSILITEISSNYAELQIWCEGLRKRSPKTRAQEYMLDVTDSQQIDELGNYITSNDLVIDALYYLAGINILTPAIRVTEDIWDRIQNVNIRGFFFVSQMVARNMIMNHGGSIVGIASQHGVVASTDRAAYCASKAAMIHLSKELSLEWAKYKIRVNTVSPTMILSEKNETLLNTPLLRKEYLTKIPMKQYARPSDVTDAVIFLSSPGAGMITGHNLIVDGGWTIS